MELHELYFTLVPSTKHPGVTERVGLVEVPHHVAVIKHKDLERLSEKSVWRKPDAFKIENEQQTTSKAIREMLEELEPLYLNYSDGSKFLKLDCIFEEAVEEELVLV